MSNPIWRSGPPLSIGWWPASTCRNSNALRWWNGSWWSLPCYEREPFSMVSIQSQIKGDGQGEIEWTDRPASWPERSKT